MPQRLVRIQDDRIKQIGMRYVEEFMSHVWFWINQVGISYVEEFGYLDYGKYLVCVYMSLCKSITWARNSLGISKVDT